MAGRSRSIKQQPTKEPKRSVSVVREENQKLREKIEKLNDSAWCYMCGAHKSKENFYVSTDPRIQSGYTPICKECARKLAERVDKNGDSHEPTKESVKLALKYLNKPYIESVWNASIQESENLTLGRTKTNVWTSYVKNIAMKNYVGMTWEDSDMFKERIVYDDEKTEQELVEEHNGLDTYDAFLKNKEDVKRLLDYDPFEQEPVRDQPFLYSQLLGMLDASEDANEDMMRVSSAIQIVRAFLQSSKIDDAIAKLMGDIQSVADNSATIKSLQDSKQKLTSMITNLAAESCLSLKNSKSNTKGEDTLSGRLRKLRELDPRSSELNKFDIDTCAGMQQVADISMSAIINKLSMDESEMAEIIKEQRVKLSNALRRADGFEEAFRIVLRENVDMRKLLESHSLAEDKDFIDLEDLIDTCIDNEDGE